MYIQGIGVGNILAVLLLSVFASGCSGRGDTLSLSPVNGTVTYQQKPLAGAQVLFTPEAGPAAFGETDDQGNFTLTTRGQAGALVGTHRVTVTAYKPFKQSRSDEEGITSKEEGERAISLIPGKYGDLRQSNLTATVEQSAENQFQFDL